MRCTHKPGACTNLDTYVLIKFTIHTYINVHHSTYVKFTTFVDSTFQWKLNMLYIRIIAVEHGFV